jgi:hypothetical protein
MYTAFIVDCKSITGLFKDKKLKLLFFLGFIFGLYVMIINIGLKAGLTSLNFTQTSGFLFGFLTILPAYYFTLTQPRIFFLCLITAAAGFIFIYYFSLVKGLNIIQLEGGDRGTGANIDRLAGYDIRQFCIFFTYLIPAAALATGLKNIYKIILISIGVFSYIVLILAFYRLAMFYVAMGTILSFFFIRKYAESTNILKIFFFILIFYLIANFFFGDYLSEINKLFSATLDYFSGKGQDTSADARADYQMPILMKLFFDNWWTGTGLIEMKGLMQFGMFGFVDIPILGTLATFGFAGMFLYYLKYIFLLVGNKINTTNINLYLNNHSPFMFYLYLTLKAYLITMITFRMFYISWELTFDYMQAEFGLVAGVYLALNNILKNYEETNL